MNELESIRDVISRHAHNSHGPTFVDGLMISASDAPTAPRPGMADPSLAVVAQGTKRTIVGDGVFDYTAGEYLIIQLEVPVVGQVTQASPASPFLGFGLHLDPTEIATLLLESVAIADRAGDPATGVGLATAERQLLAASAHLLGVLDSPQDAPVLAPLYRREVLWRLLTGPQGGLVRQIGLGDGNLSHIARTVRWLRANYQEQIRIKELADLAGMSFSTFHRHFRTVTRMTPIQYQKTVRLQEARAALLANRGDVGEVAHQVGYDSVSQFSREYRRFFGAPPRRDSLRLRVEAAESSSNRHRLSAPEIV
jgi:AraC-like DNA-binding protein